MKIFPNGPCPPPHPATTPPTVATADDTGGPVTDGDIAELRRQIRRHPCHGCPDREQHARAGERYFRQQKEVEDLERQINSRSHVIARTFDRVCAVLDELGYLDGDTVTADGQRLSRLYSELDLVAAECIRRGVWDGLNPAELAACVSVLSFESRKQSDDAEPARLPGGPVRDVLTAMGRTWAELDQLERRNGLSFLREPDSGFVWAAYRWVRGAKLEDVLDSVPGLTPGDFVRSVKQLIDLLDQIAAAASYDANRKPGRVRPRRPGRRRAAAAGGRARRARREAPEDAEDGQVPRRREPAKRDRDVAATARAGSTRCAAASSPTPRSPTDLKVPRALRPPPVTRDGRWRAGFVIGAANRGRSGFGRPIAGRPVSAGRSPRLWSCQDDRTQEKTNDQPS